MFSSIEPCVPTEIIKTRLTCQHLAFCASTSKSSDICTSDRRQQGLSHRMPKTFCSSEKSSTFYKILVHVSYRLYTQLWQYCEPSQNWKIWRRRNAINPRSHRFIILTMSFSTFLNLMRNLSMVNGWPMSELPKIHWYR